MQVCVTRNYSRYAFNLADIDECKTDDGECGAHAVCVNTVGSYNCVCIQGFVPGDNECEGKSWISEAAKS